MSAPRELQRPGVRTTVLSKKPILLLLLLILIIILLLLFSIFDEDKKNNKKGGQNQETVLIEPQQSKSSISTDEEGLNLPKNPKQRKGLASEADITAQGKKKDQKAFEPIQVVRNPPPQDPVKAALDRQRQKQLATVLQYRFEMQRKALESNPVAYKNNASMVISTSAGFSDQTGQQLGSSTRLSALNNELVRAKAKLGLGSGYGSQSTASVTTKTGLSISANQTGNNDNLMWDNGYSMDQNTNALSIKTGSIIPVVLITGIDSTLPGYISGQVSQNVWDTATGYNLLIPQGTKVFGQYQNNIIMGQERVFVAWQRLIFPDGRAMTLNDMPGGDQLGYTGLKDKVNNHYLRIYGHALLMSLVTGGTAYALNSLDNDDRDTTTFNESMGTAFANQMGQTTMGLLEKHMDMSPTLTIRPGYRLNIIAVKDLAFSEPYEGKL